MNLLLYSAYRCMPNKDITDILKKKNPVCLFCSYADENAVEYISLVKNHLREFCSDIIDLTPNFDLNTKFDLIFMCGGTSQELMFKLYKYNQYNFLKQKVLDGVLYIGNSAGSDVCGNDLKFLNDFEPPSFDISEFEPELYSGFSFIDKTVLVHASRYRLSKRRGLVFDKFNWHNYCKFKLKQTQKPHIKIPNNGVVKVVDGVIKLKVYPWKQMQNWNS